MAVGLFCSGAAAQDTAAQDIAAQALAPTGKLRIALLPLPQIALRDQLTGQFSGVVVRF